MHPAGLEIHGDLIAERRVQALRHRPAARRIKCTHALEMAREVTCGHEVGDDPLLERRMTEMAHALGASERDNERFRYDEISEPQARVQHLAEGPCVDNPLIAIETLERRQGAADVAKFAVVIVL